MNFQILIAGGTSSSRQAITTLLNTRPSLEVVGNSANMDEFITQTTAKQPELVILDGVRWIDSLEQITTILQDIPTQPSLLVLSGREHLKDSTLEAGADMFVLKGDPPKKLLVAVETIRHRRQHV